MIPRRDCLFSSLELPLVWWSAPSHGSSPRAQASLNRTLHVTLLSFLHLDPRRAASPAFSQSPHLKDRPFVVSYSLPPLLPHCSSEISHLLYSQRLLVVVFLE